MDEGGTSIPNSPCGAGYCSAPALLLGVALARLPSLFCYSAPIERAALTCSAVVLGAGGRMPDHDEAMPYAMPKCLNVHVPPPAQQMSACHKARAFMHHPHHRRLHSAFSMPESCRRMPGQQWFYTSNRADSACPTADDLSETPPSALTATVGTRATICDIHQARHSCDITVQRCVFRRGGFGATCSIWGLVLFIIVKRFPSRRCVELYSCTAAQQSQTRGPKHNDATTEKQEHRLALVSNCGVQTSEK